MERLDKDSEVACSLNDDEFRERRALARRTLIPHVRHCERSQNTLRFTFRKYDNLRQNIQEFVDLEQQCCSFLTFEIIDGGCCQPPTLTISGPPEASATIGMFANAINSERS